MHLEISGQMKDLNVIEQFIGAEIAGHPVWNLRTKVSGFCIVSSNELVVLDSLENSKQYKNAGKRFRVYGALGYVHTVSFS